MKQSITRSLADQSRTIRLPVHMVEAVNKIRRAQRSLSVKLGREPSMEEVAEEVNMSGEKSGGADSGIGRYRIPGDPGR